MGTQQLAFHVMMEGPRCLCLVTVSSFRTFDYSVFSRRWKSAEMVYIISTQNLVEELVTRCSEMQVLLGNSFAR